MAVGDVDIAVSSEPLEAEKPRLPWWTSRPAGNMKRRSCQEEEEGGDPDMVTKYCGDDEEDDVGSSMAKMVDDAECQTDGGRWIRKNSSTATYLQKRASVVFVMRRQQIAPRPAHLTLRSSFDGFPARHEPLPPHWVRLDWTPWPRRGWIFWGRIK